MILLEEEYLLKASGFCCTLNYYALAGTLLAHPAVALFHKDPAALDLQIQPLDMLKLFIDDIDVEGYYKPVLNLIWQPGPLISLYLFVVF
ncbi:hypothetical protein STEG23_029377 [Scotinomys teguina]